MPHRTRRWAPILALVLGSACISAPSSVSAAQPVDPKIATVASGVIGSVTFWGSMVAFCKLQEILISGGNVKLPGGCLL